MLKPTAISDPHILHDRPEGQLLLGCGLCADKANCGGLHLRNAGILSCHSLCDCKEPDECDVVCPNAPRRFTRRIAEIGGFGLDDIGNAPDLEFPELPEVIPLFLGNCTKGALVEVDWAAFPFSRALFRGPDGDKPKSLEQLELSHSIRARHGYVLSGVEPDALVERTWRIPELSSVLRELKNAGVRAATTPNYSCFNNTPRYDNLHAIKRIAMFWYALQSAGVPAALHLNGRTDFDFVRWASFARRHPELRAVAFEFLTGPAEKESGEIYVRRLIEFAQGAVRKLNLILRGGERHIGALKPFFARITVVDSDPYVKTIRRQKAILLPNGRLQYHQSPTSTNKQLAALLRNNVSARLKRPIAPSQRELRLQHVRPDLHESRHDEPAQKRLFP